MAIADPQTHNIGTAHQNLPEKTTFSNKVNVNPGPPEFISDRYIVVFEDGVSTHEVTKAKGLAPDFVYNHALNGFVGFLSPAELKDLKNDPRVLYIEQDKIAYISEQTLPTGIDRIDAEPISSPSSYAGDVTVAILDTGIDYFHIDLNVVQRYQCINTAPYPFVFIECSEGLTNSDGIALDGHGHGSHVAGTVAALDNEFGPVGVVPGADLWAIQVLEDNGSGTYSQIIMGIDYVIANADSIDVANMSLGGPHDNALNEAVANAVAAGVVFVVAAGNEQVDSSTRSPASEPTAITVSAYADFDGMPGGLSSDSQTFSSCTENQDDSFACFSNFGEGIDISAPGVNIFSTYRDGLYQVASGTSMAAPHVAGAAAKLIAEGVNPSDVESTLLANGVNPGDSGYLVMPYDDPDGSPDTLLYVGNSNDNPGFPDDDADGFTSDVDCDDSDNTVYPGAPELADGIDNDCDGQIDEGLDQDNDGFLDAAFGGNDCDDSNNTVYPGAPELADGIDNDCDGQIDEGLGADIEVHVGDLNWSASNKKNWNAKVTITMHGEDHSPVSGLLVQATFNGESASCTTDDLGKCQVNKTTKLDSLAFAVTDVSTNGFAFSAGTSHDPDEPNDFENGNPSATIYRGINSIGDESDGDDGGNSSPNCPPNSNKPGCR